MFIYLYLCTMARITDTKKLERLKNSTMKLVAQKGFGGASAVSIAADAKVATGYFYLHYNGKYELVNALLTEVYQEVANKLDELTNEGHPLKVLVDSLIGYFFDMANKEPVKIKFFYVLSNDYRFKLDKNIKASIFKLVQKFMDIGYKAEELDKNLTQEDIYLFLVLNTIQYINQKFKNTSTRVKFKDTDKQHLNYLLNKILK